MQIRYVKSELLRLLEEELKTSKAKDFYQEMVRRIEMQLCKEVYPSFQGIWVLMKAEKINNSDWITLKNLILYRYNAQIMSFFNIMCIKSCNILLDYEEMEADIKEIVGISPYELDKYAKCKKE